MSTEKEDYATKEAPPSLDGSSLAEIALWIATAAASGAIGNAAFAVLLGVRRRFGYGRVERLKGKVLKELKRVKRKPGVSNRDLENRVETLFAEFENQ